MKAIIIALALVAGIAVPTLEASAYTCRTTCFGNTCTTRCTDW